MKGRLLALYPAFAELSEDALGELVAHAEAREVPAGTLMFDARDPCRAFPLLLEGSIRVSKPGPNGREIKLYSVVPGEACVITSSCLLGGSRYPARGVAETKLALAALPDFVFTRLVDREPGFRRYVFALLSERLAELMDLVDAVAFQRLDRRLASLLLGKGRIVRATHQQLADELGSVREIVSRLLKGFAEQGLVSLSREHIELLDPRSLRELAEH